MGDRLRTGNPPQYVNANQGPLSLAMRLNWVLAMVSAPSLAKKQRVLRNRTSCDPVCWDADLLKGFPVKSMSTRTHDQLVPKSSRWRLLSPQHTTDDVCVYRWRI